MCFSLLYFRPYSNQTRPYPRTALVWENISKRLQIPKCNENYESTTIPFGIYIPHNWHKPINMLIYGKMWLLTNGWHAGLWIEWSRFWPWLGSLHCVVGKDTLNLNGCNGVASNPVIVEMLLVPYCHRNWSKSQQYGTLWPDKYFPYLCLSFHPRMDPEVFFLFDISQMKKACSQSCIVWHLSLSQALISWEWEIPQYVAPLLQWQA